MNAEMQKVGQRLGGLPGPQVDAGDNCIDGICGQELGQVTGLALTDGGERRLRFLARRLAVPDENKGGHARGYGRHRRRAPTLVKPARW